MMEITTEMKAMSVLEHLHGMGVATSPSIPEGVTALQVLEYLGYQGGEHIPSDNPRKLGELLGSLFPVNGKTKRRDAYTKYSTASTRYPLFKSVKFDVTKSDIPMVTSSFSLILGPKIQESSVWISNTSIGQQGNCVVTGDYGDWVACRGFAPSPTGYLDIYYFSEKIRISNENTKTSLFDSDSAEKTIKGLFGEFIDSLKEIIDERLVEYDEDDIVEQGLQNHNTTALMMSSLGFDIEWADNHDLIDETAFDEISENIGEDTPSVAVECLHEAMECTYSEEVLQFLHDLFSRTGDEFEFVSFARDNAPDGFEAWEHFSSASIKDEPYFLKHVCDCFNEMCRRMEIVSMLHEHCRAWFSNDMTANFSKKNIILE